jgi:ParB/RepB/Spo0J family partition protein
LADNILLVPPQEIQRNPENPRLIFRADDLAALEESIRLQGILVPLTVYQAKKGLVILDGERRWRCALKLGLTAIPVIVQPEPTRMQNIMMMFAIHNARKDWDPLPTAYKLRELEAEFASRNGRQPSESELAEVASLTRGEVRRLKKLLDLPDRYHRELLGELEKPRASQVLTVDHVLEVTKAASSLRKRDVISAREEEPLRQALISKVRSKVIRNTVAPRQLARISRAVARDEVPVQVARAAVLRLMAEPKYTIEQAFKDTTQKADFEHSIEQLSDRLISSLQEHRGRRYKVSPGLEASLRELDRIIRRLLGE